MKHLSIFSALVIIASMASGQPQQFTYKDYSFTNQVNIGGGVKGTNSSAFLELGPNTNNATKGFLPPRGNRAQITSPAEGLTIFDVNDKKSYEFNGTSWQQMGGDYIVKLFGVEDNTAGENRYFDLNGFNFIFSDGLGSANIKFLDLPMQGSGAYEVLTLDGTSTLRRIPSTSLVSSIDLQGVTDNGNTTNHTLFAKGLELSGDYLNGSPATIQLMTDFSTSHRAVIRAGRDDGTGTGEEEGSIRFATGPNPNFEIHTGENNNFHLVTEGEVRVKYIGQGPEKELFTIANEKVGIYNSAPGELLTLGTPGVKEGVLSFAGGGSGKVVVKSAYTAGSWTLTLPQNDGNAGQAFMTDGNGNGYWGDPSGGLSSSYVHNQNTAAQTANSWISGSARSSQVGIGISPATSIKLHVDQSTANTDAVRIGIAGGSNTGLSIYNRNNDAFFMQLGMGSDGAYVVRSGNADLRVGAEGGSLSLYTNSINHRQYFKPAGVTTLTLSQMEGEFNADVSGSLRIKGDQFRLTDATGTINRIKSYQDIFAHKTEFSQTRVTLKQDAALVLEGEATADGIALMGIDNGGVVTALGIMADDLLNVYASYSLNTNKTFAAAHTAYAVALDTEHEETGITHTGSSSEITFPIAGKYLIIATAQGSTGMDLMMTGGEAIKIGMQKWNGSAWVNVNDAAALFAVVRNNTNTGTMTYIFNATAGDKVQFTSSTNNTDVILRTTAATSNMAATPAFRVTLQKL